MSRVLCFGEVLLRFSPELDGKWIRQNEMPVFIGGAELNVASALALWKIPVEYFSVLPDHHISKDIVSHIKDKGITAEKILFRGNRIGTYYLTQGADLKNAGVIYDRKHSSFWDLNPDDVNWDELLENISWFHFSAINPALNERVAAVCRQGVEAASKKGITVSIDLNYRSKLWQYGRQPSEVMPDLVKYCDVVMGNIWAIDTMLGIPVVHSEHQDKNYYAGQAYRTSEELIKRFPKCRAIANTFRFEAGEGIHYFATFYNDGKFHISGEYHSKKITDKVGSGDAFMAGLIYGMHHKLEPEELLGFSTSAAFKKLFTKGDVLTASADEIKNSKINYA